MAKSRYRHFDVRQEDQVLIVHLVDPRLFDSLVVNALEDELLEMIDQEKPKKLLVSFDGVTHCSTTVINGLLRAKKRLLTLGGQVKLSNMQPLIREAYRLLNLDGTVFHIHDTEAEAVAAFGYTK